MVEVIKYLIDNTRQVLACETERVRMERLEKQEREEGELFENQQDTEDVVKTIYSVPEGL